MRKALISFLLCLTVLLPLAFGGCGQDNTEGSENEESSARAAVSINLWLISDKKVSAETEAVIEEAFNQLTQAKFTTKVDLVFLTESEYYDALDAKLASAAEIKANQTPSIVLPGMGDTAETTEETTAETVVNELGQRLLKYPDVGEGQVDIILITNKDKYVEYASSGVLSSLDTTLNATSKVLKDYIYPSFLSQIKYNNTTYAIPTNHLIGEYTFLLVNKEMAEKYYIDTTKINSVVDCAGLIQDIGENEAGIAPMLSYADPVNMRYWLGDNEMALVSSYVPSAATLGNRTIFRSAFDVTNFCDHMLLMQRCEDNGWFAQDPTTDNFGVALMTGDYGIVEKYQDKYEIKTLTYPTLEEDNVYVSMFGVTTYTANFDRAMEVITYINTNADAKNLLQYGVRGTHYEFDDDGNLYYLNDDYRMNNLYTGNEFLAYPAPGMDADYWENAKVANRDSKISPYYGLSEAWGNVDPDVLKNARAASDEILAKMKACANEAELSAFFAEVKPGISKNEAIKMALSISADTNSPYAVYAAWFEKNWPSAE